jgi:hypothetical protein
MLLVQREETVMCMLITSPGYNVAISKLVLFEDEYQKYSRWEGVPIEN